MSGSLSWSQTMDVQTRFLLVEEVIESFSAALGRDRIAYANHVLRVLNFFRSLSPPGNDCPQQVIIAAAFHDLGIWTAGTFDYLGPSIRLARDYLESVNLNHLEPEVEAIIVQHHKLTSYRGPFASTVETFRRPTSSTYHWCNWLWGASAAHPLSQVVASQRRLSSPVSRAHGPSVPP